MPEFADYEQKALDLPRRLMASYKNSTFCLGFFANLLPEDAARKDALTIELLAKSLSIESDVLLLNYLKSQNPRGTVPSGDFELFKIKVITGIYLFLWTQYNSVVLNSVYSSIIDLFRQDLGVHSLAAVDETLFQESLQSLSHYASYIYKNRETAGIYADLNLRLGVSIQADIIMARTNVRSSVVSWHNLCAGMLCSFGLNH